MRRFVLFAVPIFLASACASSNRAANGEPERDVKSVEINGNAHVERDDLVDGLRNHPPKGIFPFRDVASYEPIQVEVDKRRIESVYKERGYFEARVTRVEVNEISSDEVALVFFVEEGEPATLDLIEVEGAPDAAEVDAETLIELAGLKLGAPFEYAEYQKAKETIKSRLVGRGYAHAEVAGSVRVDPDRATAIAHYEITPGPLAYFGEVEVRGLKRTDESLVLNRIAWKEGERFDPLDLEQTRGRLYETGLVGNVRFDWDTKNDPERLNVVISATEGSRHELRLGGGFGFGQAHYEARARVGYTHRNFLDNKATLRLNFQPGLAFFRSSGGLAGLNVEAGAELDREDFLWPRWKLTTGVEYSRTELEAFAFQGPSARIGIGRPILNEQLTLSIGAQVSYYTFPRIEEGLSADLLSRSGLVDPLAFAALQPSAVFDRRDDTFSPTRGWYAALRGELGQGLTGDTATYAKISPELRGYFPLLGSRVVLAGKARAGSQIFDLKPIPITQRYFAGGAESQRGFGYRRLAPQGVNTAGDRLPLGGEVLVESSAEVRVDVVQLGGQWLSVVAFADAADVANSWSALEFPNLHYAAGPGLRYDTPVGPVRADLGFRLNRMGPEDPDPSSRFAFHISLGEAF
jgi:outer membrane protein assembly complex protein YaeT